jgi:hypothetical protein
LPMQFSKKYFNIGTSLEDGNYLHCFHLKRWFKKEFLINQYCGAASNLR